MRLTLDGNCDEQFVHLIRLPEQLLPDGESGMYYVSSAQRVTAHPPPKPPPVSNGDFLFHIALANGLGTATPFNRPVVAADTIPFDSFDSEPLSKAAGMALFRCETVARGNRDLGSDEEGGEGG